MNGFCKIQNDLPLFEEQKFISSIFERQALHVPSVLANTIFEDIFDESLVNNLIFFGNLHVSEIEAIRGGGVYRDPKLFNNKGFLNSSIARDLFKDGHHFRLLAVHRRDSRVYKFSKLLSAAFATIVPANAYISPPSSQGFGPHYDTHDVIVIQTTGSKMWSLYASDQGTPELPLGGQNFIKEHHEKLCGKLEQEVILNKGDMLYIPRGIFHSAKTHSEPSTHLTFGIRPPTWASLLEETFDNLYKEDVMFRRSPLFNPSMNSEYERICTIVINNLGSYQLKKIFEEKRSAYIYYEDGDHRIL